MSSPAQQKVTWASMPRKDQLLILYFLRFVEPMVRISIATYVYYQLKSLDPDVPSSHIIERTALLQTVFTLAQCMSSMVLAKMADSPRGGRKLVLVVGTAVSTISCVAFGFITSFEQALALRIIEGVCNGNVATVRTMVSEVVKDKRYQPRAFVMLPVAFNLAVIVSPLIGGQLVDLVTRFPETLGHNEFLRRWPYAPPALVTGFFSFLALLFVIFFLEETLQPLVGRYDPGLELSRKLISFARRVRGHSHSAAPRGDEEEMESFLGNSSIRDDPDDLSASGCSSTPEAEDKPAVKPQPTTPRTLPLRRIFTWNMTAVLVAATLQESHIAAYNTIWTSFLSEPVSPPDEGFRLPFRFGGGAGMSPVNIGWTQAMFGIVGLPMLLFGFVPVQAALGTVRMWRTFLLGFPVAYLLIPYIVVLPSSQPAPNAKDGLVVWVFIIFVQIVMVISSTFVVPAQLLLVNLSSPHPSALGRTHSIAFVVTSLARALSSAVSGVAYGWGSSHNLTGFAWWIMCTVGIVGFVESWLVKKGTGHDIKLSSDEDDDKT